MIISTIVAFAAGFVSGFLGFTGSLAIGLCSTIGYIGAIAIYGGIAAYTMKQNKGNELSSNTYNGVLQTQTDQNLPLPLLYGTCKLAGNRIWQDENGQTTIKRMVSFAEGEICEYSQIKLNDIPIEEISGISVNRYYGTQDQEVDAIVGGTNHLERVEKVGSLKNVAYLAISVPRGQKIDINYNLTAVVKGRKIRVYKNRFSYEVKYSENPAWVMFDFLTCYNGLGLAINNYGQISDSLIEQLFDLDSFIEAAAFCDELVPSPPKKDAEGKDVPQDPTPRFTFNMVFDAQTSARTLIDEIYRSCRGGLFLKDGRLQFKLDKQEFVSKVFSAQDIMKGSETFQTIPKEEHYDILKCTYVSPEHEWQKVEATAEIPKYRDGVPIEHSVNMFSSTNFQQSSRLAWYYVNAKRLQPYFGSFKTDYKACDLEVGDVIMIDSLLMGLERYKAKVTSVSDNGAGVFEVNWRTYDERLYTDELGSKEPRVLVSTITDVAGIPNDVLNFNVVQSNNLFNFVWQESSNNNETYEIRVGESWEYGQIVKSKITDNRYSMEIPTCGVFKFWIKAFNGYNHSENAAFDLISVDSIPNVNEVVKLDILEELSGVMDNTLKTYRKTLKLKPKEAFWQTLEAPWQNNGAYYSSGGTWGAKVEPKGVYESQVYDIGAALESIVSFNHQSFSPDAQNNILIEWAYSQDGETFTPWKIVNAGTYTFRYCKFKITLESANGEGCVLTDFTVSIDMPDKDLDMELEITDPEGLRIEYDFIKPPSIVATVNDENSSFIVICEKTNTYAILKAYTNSGELTTCKLSLRAKGY